MVQVHFDSSHDFHLPDVLKFYPAWTEQFAFLRWNDSKRNQLSLKRADSLPNHFVPTGFNAADYQGVFGYYGWRIHCNLLVGNGVQILLHKGIKVVDKEASYALRREDLRRLL